MQVFVCLYEIDDQSVVGCFVFFYPCGVRKGLMRRFLVTTCILIALNLAGV